VHSLQAFRYNKSCCFNFGLLFTVLKKTILYLALSALALLSIGPFLWVLSTALKGSAENLFAYPPQWLPASPTLENFATVLTKVPFWSYLFNSLGSSLLTVLLNLVLSVLAAYPLARSSFKGQRWVLLGILLTLMVPFQVLLIPLYLQVQTLGLTENHGLLPSWLGLSLPFAISGFGMFYMRQAMQGIPKALEEAAILDGANSMQVLCFILLPLLKPALGTLALFTLMACWGEFLWPSLLLQQEAHFTLPVGLMQLQGQFATNWRYVSAGTILTLLPTLLLFLTLQASFKSGGWQGADKG
jgi:putative chitobiose transport system permease protein